MKSRVLARRTHIEELLLNAVCQLFNKMQMMSTKLASVMRPHQELFLLILQAEGGEGGCNASTCKDISIIPNKMGF